ncbi:MAG: HTTM domain-containing protein [Gemmataceae bacterium]|nr:HTTM domain-containing protein [Gemmataceae bacterium]
MNASARLVRESAPGYLGSIARAWNRFWFEPTMPTTLGLIRICAGLLMLYVHFAYSYDLTAFFGRDGFLSLKEANRLRTETPRVSSPLGWYSSMPSLPLPPEDRPSRTGILDWIEGVWDDPDPKTRDLIVGMLWQPELPPDASAWGNHLPPALILGLPPDPMGASEANLRGRGLVGNFISKLPKDKAERTRVLQYMRDWGLDPRQVNATGGYYWSIWFHVSDPTWMVVTHLGILLAMFLFTIGFCTRITSVLSWLGALSYLQRSPMTLFGGDTMMNILLIYLMIGPSGAALSVDRWLEHWWRKRQALKAGLPEPEWTRPEPMISANFALRLLQVHFCIIYFSAGTSKLLGGQWWNGQAIYYTMANYEFSPMRHGYYLSMMRFLAEHRWLWEIAMAGGTYFTLALELSLPFLVWNRRLRPFYVAGAFMLHTAIALFMGLVTFSLMMATMVLAFLPSETVDRFLARFEKHKRKQPEPVEAASDDEREDEEAAPAEKSEKKESSTHVKTKHRARR